jgi:hypothetical protein
MTNFSTPKYGDMTRQKWHIAAHDLPGANAHEHKQGENIVHHIPMQLRLAYASALYLQRVELFARGCAELARNGFSAT